MNRGFVVPEVRSGANALSGAFNQVSARTQGHGKGSLASQADPDFRPS